METSKFVSYLPNSSINIECSRDLRNFIYKNSLKTLPILHFVPHEQIKEVSVKFPQ